jgi:hypothetical protein
LFAYSYCYARSIRSPTRTGNKADGAIEALARSLRNPLAFDGSVKSLASAGAEVIGDVVNLPDPITGRLVPLWPTAVLIGPLPSEPKLAAHYKMVRTSTTSEYGAAWRKWLAGSVKHLDADMGLQLLSASEQKALSEGLDQSGGFVVPADVGVGIFARIGQRSVFRRYTTVRPTAKDVYSQVTFMEHATSGSIYSSDWVASWAGEVPSQSDIDPRFGTL